MQIFKKHSNLRGTTNVRKYRTLDTRLNYLPVTIAILYVCTYEYKLSGHKERFEVE